MGFPVELRCRRHARGGMVDVHRQDRRHRGRRAHGRLQCGGRRGGARNEYCGTIWGIACFEDFGELRPAKQNLTRTRGGNVARFLKQQRIGANE